jgi:hypothetical protein
MAMLVEDSSTKTRRSGSTPSRRSLKALLLPSSRSVAPSVFFVGPTELVAYGPAHRRGRNPHPPTLFAHLAVLLPKGGLLVLFELLPQRSVVLGVSEEAPLSSRGGAGREVLAHPPLLDPAFECGEGDGEGLDNVLSRDSPLERIDRPRPEILRVDAHARHLYTGPLYSQHALVAEVLVFCWEFWWTAAVGHEWHGAFGGASGV